MPTDWCNPRSVTGNLRFLSGIESGRLGQCRIGTMFAASLSGGTAADIFLDNSFISDYNTHDAKANKSSGCRANPAESELYGSDP